MCQSRETISNQMELVVPTASDDKTQPLQHQELGSTSNQSTNFLWHWVNLLAHLGEIWMRMTIKSMTPASYFQAARGGMEEAVIYIYIWISRVSPDTPFMQCSYVVRRENEINIMVVQTTYSKNKKMLYLITSSYTDNWLSWLSYSRKN